MMGIKILFRSGLGIFFVYFIAFNPVQAIQESIQDILIVDNKEKNLVTLKNEMFFSKNCKNVSDCFSIPHHFEYYPNQSPFFSLCYQSGGSPKFASLKSSKEKVEACIKNRSVVSLGYLMEAYKRQKSDSKE